MTTLAIRLRRAAIALVLTLTSLGAVQAETFTGSNIDSRLLIGIESDSSAIQKWLPEGWSPIAFPQGPLKGANLLVVLIDRKLQLDAEGAPATPANMRAFAIGGLAKQESGKAVRLYLYRIYTTDPGPDPYGNAVAADVGRSTATDGPANGARQRSENWSMVAENGNSARFELSFASGKRAWSSAEANPFSNTNPAFSRIYRYDQLVDVVSSAALGKPLGGSVALSVTGSEIAGLLGDTPKITALMDVPVYVRKVFLP